MCGIFGIVTKKPKIFDYATFTTLGIANDSRGGDSCGVFIDGKIEYGVDKDKLFQNFFINNNFLEEFWGKPTTIALGHCRKASVGNVSRETAQPVVLKDKNGTVRFVLLHNGTIHNYKELAAKYIPGVKIDGLTDSQVMARIFYYKGYDCLEEYIGGAVFFIVDYRQPEPLKLVFKGASKKTEYVKDETEERPLYYSCADGELVFSSIYIWLESLRSYNNIYSLTPNNLWKFDGNKLTLYKAISRKNAQQDKKYTPVIVPSGRYAGYYDPGYYSGNVQSTTYLGTNKLDNTYSIGGTKIHGTRSINYLGKIGSISKSCVSRYDQYVDVSFFDGIALSSEKWFRVLEKFRKRLKLSEEEFVKNFQNLLRYFSVDKLYFDGTRLLQATSPEGATPFTGEFQMIGSSWCKRYINGIATGGDYYKSNSDNSTFEKLESSDGKLTVKDVKSICRQLLMK